MCLISNGLPATGGSGVQIFLYFKITFSLFLTNSRTGNLSSLASPLVNVIWYEEEKKILSSGS